MSSSAIYPAHPEQILKALGKVWTSLGYEERQHNAPTVLRACAMTLIVASDEPDNGFFASQTISELMHEHPSRGIVLAISDKAERRMEARVLAQCWKPFGKAQQICCEQIEITVRPEAWPNVGPTLVGLTPADLPVIFWCRHSAALSPSATRYQVAGLEAVMDLSSKVVLDTHGEDLPIALDLISQWRAKGRIIADLQWARLTAWRQPLAQVFDNATRDVPFSQFHTIEVGFTDEKPSARPLYFAGWLSAPRKTRVLFNRVKGFGPGIHSITLRSDSEVMKVERTSHDTMTFSSTNGRERRYIYAEPSLYRLLTEELSITGPDPAFDAAFNRARELANDYYGK